MKNTSVSIRAGNAYSFCFVVVFVDVVEIAFPHMLLDANLRYSTLLDDTRPIDAMLRYLTLRYLTLCYLMLRYLTLRYLMLRHLTLRYLTLRYLTLRYLTLRYFTLRYWTLRYAT
jgi:hypothetical protein